MVIGLCLKSSEVQFYNNRNILIAIEDLVDNIFKLRFERRQRCPLAASAVTDELWHRRLGRLNSNYMNTTQNATEGVKVDRRADISKINCVVCCEGKLNRLPFPHGAIGVVSC